MQNLHFASLYNPIKKCFPSVGYKVWNVYLQNCFERTGAGDVRSVLTVSVHSLWKGQNRAVWRHERLWSLYQEYNTEVYWHSPWTVHTNHKRNYRQDRLAKRNCSTLSTLAHTCTNCIYRMLYDTQVHVKHFWVTRALFHGTEFRKMCSVNHIALFVV